jgi:hypothetical protein
VCCIHTPRGFYQEAIIKKNCNHKKMWEKKEKILIDDIPLPQFYFFSEVSPEFANPLPFTHNLFEFSFRLSKNLKSFYGVVFHLFSCV